MALIEGGAVSERTTHAKVLRKSTTAGQGPSSSTTQSSSTAAFEQCAVYYSGGDYQITNTSFINCAITLRARPCALLFAWRYPAQPHHREAARLAPAFNDARLLCCVPTGEGLTLVIRRDGHQLGR